MMAPIVDMIESFKVQSQSPPHLLLMPIAAPTIDFVRDIYQQFGMDLVFTKSFGFGDLGHIAYNKYSGSDIYFIYFKRIELYFGLLFLLFLALMSCAMSPVTVNYNSLKILLENCFELFLSLFSTITPKTKTKINSSKQIIVSIGFWLISVLFIRIMFQNYILEDMVIVIPKRVIDSWEDLRDTPDVKIRVPEGDLFDKYARESNEEMAHNFRDRIETYSVHSILENETFCFKVMDEMSSGRTALIGGRMELSYSLKYLHMIYKYPDPNFLRRLHISRYGGGTAPNVISIIESAGSYLLQDINKM